MKLFSTDRFHALAVLALLFPMALNAQDFNAEPYYGELNLSAGFQPDPLIRSLIAGGTTAVNSQNAGCSGFITGAPDFRLNYTRGDYGLGIFAASDIDTTLIVRAPDGQWHCNDDSEHLSGLNPGVSFSSPASGRYDIWVGVFSSENSLKDARIVITELATSSWSTLDLDTEEQASPTPPAARWFGDDSGIWPEDGVCDDAYFSGSGAGSLMLAFNRFRDATDCRQLFDQGSIQLNPQSYSVFNESLSSSDAKHTGRNSYQDTFEITADSSHIGQRIVARMRADDFDSFLIIRSPSGIVVENDDHLDTRNSLAEITVNETGVYQIIATSYEADISGTYSLEHSRLTSVQQTLSSLNNSLLEERLSAGSRQQDAGTYVHAIEFTAQQGQSLDAILSSSEFDSYLYLYGPNNLIQSNDDFESGNNDSRLTTTLPTTGLYVLTASSFDANSTGRFTLALNRPEPAPQPEPEPARTPVADLVPETAPAQSAASVQAAQTDIAPAPVIDTVPDVSQITLPTTATIQYGSKR
ncbi:MAG: hypothetical protein Q8S94_06730 [Pseudohongiella sp.]|nr:hypothetical protein [Pseudohongiella sp.]